MMWHHALLPISRRGRTSKVRRGFPVKTDANLIKISFLRFMKLYSETLIALKRKRLAGMYGIKVAEVCKTLQTPFTRSRSLPNLFLCVHKMSQSGLPQLLTR